MFDKTSTAVYHTGISTSTVSAYYIDNFNDSSLFSSATNKLSFASDKSLLISIFEGSDSKKYVMFVNKDINNSINKSIGLSQNYNVAEFDSLNGTIGTASSVSSINLNIEAGSAAVYVIG